MILPYEPHGLQQHKRLLDFRISISLSFFTLFTPSFPKNQKSTLNRWVENHLGRPQDNGMKFLMAETGLEEEQINHWWTNHESTRLNIEIPLGEVAPIPEVGLYNSESNDFGLVNDNLPDSSLDQFENDMQNFVFPGLGNWSLPEQSCHHFQELQSHLYGFQSQDNRGDGSPQRRLSQAEITSICDNDVVPSIPSHVDNFVSDRCTWGFTPTFFSVDEDQAAGSLESCQNFQTYQGINQANITSMSNSQYDLPSDLHKNQFTIRHHKSESIPRLFTRLRHESGTNPYVEQSADIPQRVIRYSCTICRQAFERKGAKGDWKRHEQTKCDQQKLWYCMLKEPITYTQVLNVWSCMLCDYANRSHNEMTIHLSKKHRFQNCWDKPLAQRCHPRKDKLRDHLKKHHNLSERFTGWEAWHQDQTEKKAWGCGFCGDCFFTWDARLDHIAEHYEKQRLDISQWSLTNVIKGLLKQAGEWDVLTAWISLVGHNDQLYSWLNDDALILQRKLECHEDTPQNLAQEARRLAGKSSHNFVPQTWPLSGPHAARLAQDMFAESLSRISGQGDNGNSYGNTYNMANIGQVNPGIQVGNYNGFI
ncbi:b80e3150-f350-4f8f-9113-57efb09cb6ec [Sclerotinia trifoliorum]|uniref:B80e3150-f350-4f8f-9113-57efb09cb6ec n=1 Tax=Sclerotinia trifoliorum TaxID=28548 RepID=A0A8H2ZSX5_9HELO|nr:b80e3150-f350-4f8f-9113-57efb09cb6ec [Sclerotinia trifoliorum]